MAITPELIERAYVVFARYPKKLSPTVASFAAEIAVGKRVRATRLREITCEDIEVVWWNATGDERAFKHFLPRVLECLGCGSVLLDDVKRRLRAQTLAAWPEDERALAQAILDA